jgi:hypothetical protein
MRSQDLHERFSRIVPERTRNFRVLIAGAGMVGSWTALALARMVGKVDIWDFDAVSEFNVGVQAYTQADIGRNKIDALQSKCFGLPLTGHAGRFDPYDVKEYPPADIVISAVDSMAGRSEVAMFAKAIAAPFFIDTRVFGEIACIHPVALADIPNYLEYLPAGDELVSAPCGAKGTAFAGMYVAARVCAIVNSIGRSLPLPPKEVFHIGMNTSVVPEVKIA